jgi:hypothetical protein
MYADGDPELDLPDHPRGEPLDGGQACLSGHGHEQCVQSSGTLHTMYKHTIQNNTYTQYTQKKTHTYKKIHITAHGHRRPRHVAGGGRHEPRGLTTSADMPGARGNNTYICTYIHTYIHTIHT